MHRIAVIAGDGVGKEVEGIKVMRAALPRASVMGDGEEQAWPRPGPTT